jgi:hypothetical protein
VRYWTKAEDVLLGTMSDEDLAKKLGRPKMGVSLRRQQFKIPVFAPQRVRWTPADDALFGRFSNEEIVRRLGRTILSVKGRRFRVEKTPPH